MPFIHLCLIFGTLTCALSLGPPALAQEPAAAGSPVPLTIELPLTDGCLEGGALFGAVADDLHWIAGSIASFSHALGSESPGHQWIAARHVDELVNTFPQALSYGLNPSGQRRSVVIDRPALARLLADNKSDLRVWLAKTQHIPLSSMTKVPETWRDAPAMPPRIVVTLAGVHALEDSAIAVALELHRRTNLPAYVFSYPNDAPVMESAQRLGAALELLHREYPRSRVTLVAHSFGGLVCRGLFEKAELAAVHARSSIATRTGVDQLIQVCPPNHGSALSDYAPLLEGVEQIARLANRGRHQEQRLLLRMITDGFNEASQDLNPRSAVLQELNLGGRCPDLSYTILAGNDGPLRSGATQLLGTVWETIAQAVEEPQQLDYRMRALIDCDELRKGSGDGVVSLSSAKLEGVADFEVLEMHHLTWGQLDQPAGQRLMEAISSRLGIAL